MLCGSMHKPGPDGLWRLGTHMRLALLLRALVRSVVLLVCSVVSDQERHKAGAHSRSGGRVLVLIINYVTYSVACCVATSRSTCLKPPLGFRPGPGILPTTNKKPSLFVCKVTCQLQLSPKFFDYWRCCHSFYCVWAVWAENSLKHGHTPSVGRRHSTKLPGTCICLTVRFSFCLFYS